jgi:hypothetical protein
MGARGVWLEDVKLVLNPPYCSALISVPHLADKGDALLDWTGIL